jgi:fibronectin-binding autotransporter adhesin
VNFGGAGAQIALNQAGVIFGNNFVFGSSTADSKVVLVNPVNINSGANNGTRKFTVRAGIGGAEATSAELQGVVSNAPGFDNGIRKEGDGMLILSATNTYTGPTLVTAGSVQIGNGGTTGSITSTGAVRISSGATFAVNRSDLLTVGNTISGAGDAKQVGSGTTILTASNTYNGGTTVSDGAFVANNTTGSATGTGAVLVETGATIGGSGSISGTTTIDPGGFLTGGADINAGTRGTLTFGGGLNAAGSTWLVDPVETTSMDSVRIAVIGNLNITNAIFTDRFSGTFIENNTYTIGTYTGTLTGTFLNWADDTDRAFTNGSYRINYDDSGAITLTAVPEPRALLSLLLIIVTGWWFFRKRSSAEALP